MNEIIINASYEIKILTDNVIAIIEMFRKLLFYIDIIIVIRDAPDTNLAG
jgi:hypothetical protein